MSNFIWSTVALLGVLLIAYGVGGWLEKVLLGGPL